MTRFRSLISATITLALAAGPALAGDVKIDPPGVPFFGSGEGRNVSSLASKANPRGCALDDTAGKRKRLDEAAAAFAEIKDPAVKQAFTKWLAEARAWFDAHAAGIPGGGTWAELDQARADAEAALARYEKLPAWPRGQPKVPEHLLPYVETYVALANASKTAKKLHRSMVNKTRCDQVVKDWGTLSFKMDQHVIAVRNMVHGLTSNMLIEADRWKPNIRFPEGAPPADYWGHAAYVMNGIDAIAKARALKRQVDVAVALAPLLDESKGKLLATVPDELAKAIAEWEPKAAAELANVEMPPMKKDATRTKSLMKALSGVTTGKQLGPVTTGGAVSKEEWTERVVVKRETNGVWVRDEKRSRDYYSVYYAWQPTPETAGAPDLPGAPASATCELWTMSFGRSGGGGGFAAGESWRLGYLPCANTSKVSKRKP